MCGIVGILGRAPVAEQLVDSLKRLEYRGYDSAGVATLEGDHLERRRAGGKPRKLEKRLRGAGGPRARGGGRRGQAENPREAAAQRAARGSLRHWSHPLGHPWQAER